MVPLLSALSLALCHEALEGGGNQQMGTIISQKETSPLAHFVCNSLPHKSHRFCSPMRNNGAIKMEPSNTQKETSPLAHSVRNSLPHKSHRFCSPMRK